MFTAADWAKLNSDPKGQAQNLAAAVALAMGFPILKILPFVPSPGMTYTANIGAASTQKATRAVNAAFTESAPTIAQIAFMLRAAGGELKLDINQIDADTTGVLRGMLLTQKLKDIGARLFRMFFSGDKDAGSAEQFEGLNNLVPDLGAGQVVVAGANGAALTSAMMDEALSKVPGANLILSNRTLASKIDGFSVGVQKTVLLNQGGLSPDMFVQSYKGVPILPVGMAPDDTTAVQAEILPFTETQGSSDLTSRVSVVRIGVDGIYGRQNKPLEIAAPRRAGAFEFNDLNWLMAPCVSDNVDAAAQIKGITNA